ncbi:nicotinamide-nucleotide amidase [Flavimobilis soli]|uniref:Nicotinamide-nucleotide amidase n=1 Tax=Flavimobilis soli TaxID=442709 RepID=A0A2A9EAL8_9MICO|nr:CinA family protein [Flavimobilis soli]PFG35924.1 nicotinamide-nucleotide amidase [Flavimobilis soli]
MTRSRAAELVALAGAQGRTLAVAESLTGGALASAIVDVPGASAVFRGGVVAYATDLKASVLGVDADLLAREGAVHPDVAEQMATGVTRVAGASVGLATTGVAGPEPQDGQPVGTVFVAAAFDGSPTVRRLSLDGDRATIRAAAVAAAIRLALEVLGGQDPGAGTNEAPGEL